MNDPTPQQQPGDADIRTRRFELSMVWLVPVVAVLIGLSMLIQAWYDAGPTVQVTFESAGSLTPGKSPVKYRNVVIGEVSAVQLSEDHRKVIVTLNLNRDASAFTRKDSRYWVVRPRIGAGGISGLDTLLSGDFIAADPGTTEEESENFQGLESPPPITYGEPGTRFQLKARDLGSLDIGSSVYYRKVQVGEVVSYQLDDSGDWVNIDIFIAAPHDQFVTRNTRFWNASGIDIDVSATGLEVDSQSLISIIAGGIAFGSPETERVRERADSEQSFRLFDERKTAMASGQGPARSIRMVFRQSLGGLSVAAPVNFVGMKIGEVTRIALDYEAESGAFPVIVDATIYPQLMGPAYDKLFSTPENPQDREQPFRRVFAKLIEQGLQAEVRSANLLTGTLYIGLDFYRGEPQTLSQDSQSIINIPTRRNRMDQLQAQVMTLVERVSDLPLESIAGNLDQSLLELQQVLQQVSSDVLPGTTQTLQQADQLMDNIQKTLNSAQQALAPDSPERARLARALAEVERMSRSIRELADYLRRHPDALLRGRRGPTRSELRP